jgi:hypothetical protein
MDRDTLSTAELSEFIPEIWAQRSIELFQKELMLAKNVARDSEFTREKVGNTIHVTKRGALVANRKLPHQPVTLQQPEADTVDIVLDQHWEVSFTIEDVASAQTNQDVMDGYVQDAINVLGEKVESDLFAETLNFDAIGSDGDTPDRADVLTARATLTRNGAPRSNRHLYLNTGDVNIYLDDDKFIDAGEADIAEGTLGRFYGFQTHESAFLEDQGSPAKTWNVAMHRNALVLATRALPEPKGGAKVAVVEKDGIIMRVVYSYNADYLAEQVTIDMLYGTGVLDENLGVRIAS